MTPLVLLASTNSGKLREWSRLLRGAPLRLALGADLPPVEEDGDSFEANARIKAEAWGHVTELPVLAEDSGLEVDALEGRPGVFSARMGRDDGERIRWLLDALGSCRRREARFVCTAVLLAPDRRRSWVFTGTCEGTIAREPRGDGGFGYDPVFCPRGEERTFGEMSPEEKERFSHRGAAAKRMVQALPSVVESLLG